MAKERAEKLHKKAEKPEKKVSKDKVKKQKKEKKSKRAETPEDSNNEPSKLEDTPAAAEEPSAESVPEVKPKKEKKRSDEKAEKSKKKEKKSKKAALEEAVADSASNSTELPVRPISKDSDSDSSDDDDDNNGAALFTIDTKPTPIDPSSIPQKAVDAADEDDEMALSDGESKGPSKMKPPTGLNRQARRRIRMIEQQREKIAKELGADAGPDEVQARLDKWVEDYDGKAAARIDKKKRRKDKEAARIRNKTGKLLTGRRLKERKKVLDKMDKKASKRQGLSAQNAA